MLRRLLQKLLIGLVLVASPALAESTAQSLARVLQLDEVITVLRDEGLQYGKDLETDMLGDGAGQYFNDQISRIYDHQDMTTMVRGALDAEMTDAEISATVAFFDTEQGQHILSLETAARVAMSDPSVEAVARETYAELQGSDDARLGVVSQFIEVNDLLERNVASALNANYQFFRGLVDGGGAKMGEEDILAEVWAQEAELREDTESWLYGFLLMAYQPLEDDELQDYVAFSETGEGQALNSALFTGFDAMYRSISYDLGLAVAQALDSSDI